MKKIRTLLLVAFGASLFLAPLVHAQDDTSTLPRRRERMGDRMEQRMIKELGLTADQEAKWKEIGQQQRAAMQAIRSDSSLSEEARRAKAMQTMKQFDEQRRALLTADQQKKFDEIRQKMRERLQNRRADHGGATGDEPPPPPPEE